MVEESERGGNYFALGAIVGAALGMAMAMLFAPQPGEKTRAVLKEKGIELQQRARKMQPNVSAPDFESGKEDVVAAEETAEGPGQE